MKSSIATVVAILLFSVPAISSASICDDNEALLKLSDDNRVNHDYFDDYYISRHKGVYQIVSRKRLKLDYSTLVRVMDRHENYPEFMPGYRSIKVHRNPNGQVLTAIRFRTTFSPFTSRFTNEVEMVHNEDEYQQCWRQLDEKDELVIEEYAKAPKINQGFWRVIRLDSDVVEIAYFSMIKPPVSIPSLLYRQIVKGSYHDVFERTLSSE